MNWRFDNLRDFSKATRIALQIRGRRRPPRGSAPALVEPPRGPLPLSGGAEAPLEYD